jgi:hypothetical protein
MVADNALFLFSPFTVWLVVIGTLALRSCSIDYPKPQTDSFSMIDRAADVTSFRGYKIRVANVQCSSSNLLRLSHLTILLSQGRTRSVLFHQESDYGDVAPVVYQKTKR